MTKEKKTLTAEYQTEQEDQMTAEQQKAFDEFLDYMADLYRKYSYLFDEEDLHTRETSS